MRMNDFLEEIALVVHVKDHKLFEEVSENMSKTMGHEVVLFYEWCPKCKEFADSKRKKP